MSNDVALWWHTAMPMQLRQCLAALRQLNCLVDETVQCMREYDAYAQRHPSHPVGVKLSVLDGTVCTAQFFLGPMIAVLLTPGTVTSAT
jgi:hypothetical protein